MSSSTSSPIKNLKNLLKIATNMPRGNKTVVYTDGACRGQGTSSNPQAGIGVYWPNQPSNNISSRLSGRQTNQRAELEAATTAINQAKNQGYTDVTVRTDSHYVKKGAESWMPEWERTGWSRHVENKSDFQRLGDAMKDVNVKFEYVPSAENLADPLAKEGAGQSH